MCVCVCVCVWGDTVTCFPFPPFSEISAEMGTVAGEWVAVATTTVAAAVLVRSATSRLPACSFFSVAVPIWDTVRLFFGPFLFGQLRGTEGCHTLGVHAVDWRPLGFFPGYVEGWLAVASLLPTTSLVSSSTALSPLPFLPAFCDCSCLSISALFSPLYIGRRTARAFLFVLSPGCVGYI